MTAYAFGTGRLEGDNGCKTILHGVSLDFDQGVQSLSQGEKVKVALGDGELKITGIAERIDIIDGEIPEFCQIFFKTTASNFGVSKEVTIKLNNCRMDGNSFEAKADLRGNIFTLSMEE